MRNFVVGQAKLFLAGSIGGVQNRSRQAARAHDNPAVALDTLAPLPEFDKTLDLREHGKITPESVYDMLGRTGILCNVATSKNPV